jgi:hypothetical protein
MAKQAAILRIAGLIKKAINWTAGVIQRGRLEIDWCFNPADSRFYVVVFIAGRAIDGWVLDRFQFGRMFRKAPHWLGGAA